MEQIGLIISLAFLPYLCMALENSDSHMYGDCLHSKGPRFSPSPQWPDSPHMAGGASRLKFTCTVNTTLTPSFNVTWTKDGEVIQRSDHVHFEMENQVLYIGPVLINSDQGMYACMVMDSAGRTCIYKGYEIIVPITPADAPSIVATSPVNGVKVVSLGDSTQISCTMTIGSTPMELERLWKRNGTQLEDTSHYTWDNLNHENDRKELILNITNVTIKDLGEYTCVAKNKYGTDNRTITLQQYQPDAGEVLKTWQITVIAAGGGLVIALLVVVMVIRVKYRKDKADWLHLDPENYDVPVYPLEYDVFISYSSEDEEWVKSILFKELLKMGYNVNIDFKDFVPGMAIAENVMDSIYKSRKTIVLMSRNFLRSMWGQFELQQAHNKAIAQRKDVLILIKYDKCKVPGKLMGKTFLDWTDASIQPHFWQRLHDAIGDPVNYAEINQRPVPADNKNTDEVKVDKENNKNLENDEDNAHMRQKKKRQEMEECDKMNTENMEGIRISREERMQLIT